MLIAANENEPEKNEGFPTNYTPEKIKEPAEDKGLEVKEPPTSDSSASAEPCVIPPSSDELDETQDSHPNDEQIPRDPLNPERILNPKTDPNTNNNPGDKWNPNDPMNPIQT